jgi:anti-sigma factor (TIGR02949 family)
MRPVDIGKPDCKKVMALLDFYLSSELTIETTTEIASHLERCPRCLAAFLIRERVKRRLRAALTRDTVSSELRHCISRMIRKVDGSWIRRIREQILNNRRK